MRVSDHASMLKLCAQIWDGNDYIPLVWDDWLSHTSGQFTTITDDRDAFIGFGKLTSITERDWWIEGIRIDPAFQGQGVGRRLHQYHLDLWQRLSPPRASVRLLTDHDNHVMRHLSGRAGFRLLGDVVPFRAESVHAPHTFRKISADEARSFFSLVERSHYYQTHHRLGGTFTLWRWAEVSRELLANYDIWLWREGRGLLLIEDVDYSDNPVNAPCTFVDFIGAAQDDLAGCLQDARALSSSLNRSVIGVGLLLSDTILIHALTEAGYTRAWNEGSLYLYEKRK
jgi:GNAT superfamily N-acetyltransferase